MIDGARFVIFGLLSELQRVIKRDSEYFVYIVECRDGSYYTGYTNNLEKRLKEHNGTKRGAKYLRGKLPVKLVWNKVCKNQRFAMRTEKTIKIYMYHQGSISAD